MVAVAWRELKGLVLHPSEVLEGILTRHRLALSLALGMLGYYAGTLQISELLLPPALGGEAYFLVNVPVALGHMALTVLLVHVACRMVVQTEGRWVDLLSLWGYTQVPGIVLTALAAVFFAMIPSASGGEIGILWILLIIGVALFLSIWGLILRLQVLKVCYNMAGRQLLGAIVFALIFYGSVAWLERVFLDENGLVPHTGLNAMEPTASPFLLGGKSPSLPFDTLTYRLRNPERGEIVGFVPVGWQGLKALIPGFRLRFVGRVVGLPGETVEVREGGVVIDHQLLREPYLTGPLVIRIPPTTLPPEHFLILGDNRSVPPGAYGGGIVAKERIQGRLTEVGRLKWRLMAGKWPW